MKAQKRESILNTARQMFVHYGIRKTSLNEIARMARVAKATIYNYFGSKEQVYLEVLNREANELMDRMCEAVAQIKSPLEKLRFFYRTRLTKMKEISNVWAGQGDGEDQLRSLTDIVRERLFRKEVGLVQAILEEGVREGVFRMDNVIQTARVIGFALQGLETDFPVPRSREEREADFEQLFNVLCRGILAEKREA